MDHMDLFNFRILFVLENEVQAGSVNKAFTKAGGENIEVESVATNVLPRLQNKDIAACYICERAVVDPRALILNIKRNSSAKQVPLVVWTENPDFEHAKLFYDLGVNYVIQGPITPDEANKSLHIVDSLIRFSDQFKTGKERFFRN
jgi:DNA-binding NtrC family response regulator